MRLDEVFNNNDRLDTLFHKLYLGLNLYVSEPKDRSCRPAVKYILRYIDSIMFSVRESVVRGTSKAIIRLPRIPNAIIEEL